MMRSTLATALLGLLPLVPAARAQTSPHGLALELHVGYGGGGSHPDELVGGGLTYRFSPYVEGTGFMTAVVARSSGRAVFAGAGLRLIPTRGRFRPYLAFGPLLAVRAYTVGHLGEFASLGLEAALDNPARRWRLFVEGRAMHGGNSWTQLVGGVRATVTHR
jgi:hypothetical protein